MRNVNVLVVTSASLDEGFLDDIKAVDPRLTIVDGRQAFAAEIIKENKQGQGYDRFLKELGLSSDWHIPETMVDLDTLLAQAEVIFISFLFPDKLITRAPRAKWIHIGNTGIDQFIASDIFSGRVIVTNSRGAIASPMAELTVGFIFALAKNIPRLLKNKKDKHWTRLVNLELLGKTVGIIGLGAVGSQVARLAKGIGMRVIAVEKAAIRRSYNIWGIDEVYTGEELLDMLHESDFVVMSAPLTAETQALIGEKEFRAMKATAYLINVARGKLIDEPVLVRALKEGWIAGAGLDVFDTEPLPSGNELWELPNVVISPHIAGSVDTRSPKIVGLFCNNLKRYLAGQQLINIVDKEKGF